MLLERALAAPPADGIEGQGYRRVRAEGRFRHDLEARVQATFSAPGANPVLGYDLLTPLALRDGRLIVVNRGFVPADLAASPQVARPAGEVSVTGLLREPEARGSFTPADDPARGLFFAPDPATIARAKGYAANLAAPLLLDAERAGDGLPRAGRSRLVLPNDHLQYALTWFGLAAALAGVFGVHAARVAGVGAVREKAPPSP